MRVSIWRLSHLWLAIVSGLFLLVASITGVILSLEPAYESSFGYYIEDVDKLLLADLIETVERSYQEVTAISRDHNGYITVTVLTDGAGESTFYINPFSGAKIGDMIDTLAVFEFTRTLHRSLFLGKTGRFIVGLTAVVLILIAITGFILLIKKQGGLKGFFNKIIRQEFNQDYHTILARVFIITILIVGGSGSFLFTQRFLPMGENISEPVVDFENLKESPAIDKKEFEILQSTQVGMLEKFVYPFSPFVDDFFELKLSDRQLSINQFTGELTSEQKLHSKVKLSKLMYGLHTGEGQPWWAALLGITSFSMIFFIYSGFKIYAQRPSSTNIKISNLYPKEICTHVILYGSELGSSQLYAQVLQEALVGHDVKSYLAEMNGLEQFESIEYLFILTSTYGDGDAPASAVQFFQRFAEYEKQLPCFQYSVVGFGSSSYPKFCQFAFDVNDLLSKSYKAKPMVAIATVDNGDQKAFDQWVEHLEHETGLVLSHAISQALNQTIDLKIVRRTYSPNPDDNTYLLEFKTKGKELKPYKSGDLLKVRSEVDGKERYYSMSVCEDKKTALLSIKKHEHGLISNHLSNLKMNSLVSVSLQTNLSFHFPKKSPQVLLIANGTGIAPFLGMIANNTRKTPITLYWGGQNEASYQLYRDTLYQQIERGHLKEVITGFSREYGKPTYIQDMIALDERLVVNCMKIHGVIMLCGSRRMQEGVEQVLSSICHRNFNQPIQYFKNKKMIKSDCY